MAEALDSETKAFARHDYPVASTHAAKVRMLPYNTAGILGIYAHLSADMESSSRPIRQYLPELLRLLLFLGVIMLISLLFPNRLIFKYQYEKQQTWRYDKLVAPFDFPILKTEEAIEAERRTIIQGGSPVYVSNTNISVQSKAAFLQQFEQQLRSSEAQATFPDAVVNADLYRNYALALLDRLYQRGLINLTPEHRDGDPQRIFSIINGNRVQQQTAENILTVADGLEMLSDTLPYAPLPEPEFLLPLLQDNLQANLFFSPERSQQLLDQALTQVVTHEGLVEQGDLIIARNGIITEPIYQQLRSFEQAYEKQVVSKQSFFSVYAGYFLLTGLIVAIFALYLRRFAKLIYNRPSKLIFILLWLVLYSYLVYMIKDLDSFSVYLLPFCIVPIVIKTFYNDQLALFTHIIVVLIASFLCALGYEFTFLQILAGTVIVLSNVDTRDWGGFFRALAFIFIAYALGFLGLSLIKEGNWLAIDWSVYPWLFLNAFLTLLAYPLIPLMERLFGFVSPITLTELSDMNQPLLRELALKAPGTLQHSLQVGNLAEAAARRVQADPLLVKVAALYHDIGKIQQPQFFIENQSADNPHQKLSPQESAQIILQHVSEGVKMARKAGLPPVIVDFILTHHGKTRIEYFYQMAKQQSEAIDEAAFTYLGPLPRSKEESIVMLADSVEAACKSLDKPTEEELFGLIDKIIAKKLNTGQLKHSLLSFQELEECRLTFRQIMKSIHHIRVAYPEEEE